MENMFVKKSRKIAISIVLILSFVVGGCTKSQATLSVSDGFEEYSKQLFAKILSEDTMSRNSLVANPKNYGIQDEKVCIPMFSEAEFKKSIQEDAQIKKKLQSFDYNKLTNKQQDLYDTILFRVGNPKEAEKFMYYEQKLNPYLGVHVSLPSTLMDYNFTTKADYLEYFDLLKCIPDYFQNILEYEQKRSELGLFMSDRQLDEVIETCNQFIKDKEENSLIVVFDENIDRFQGLTKEEVVDYKGKNRQAVINDVIPAYENLILGIDKLRGTGVNEGGLCKFQYGKEYYEYLAKIYTGSSMTVTKMKEAIGKKFAETMVDLQRLAMKYPDLVNEVVTATSSYTDPEEILERLEEAATKDYPDIRGLKCHTRYVDPSLEDSSAPAFVYTPQIDGPEDNYIYINGSEKNEASDLFTTIAHEGYPGHLYQLNYYKQQNNNPLFTLFQSRGYVEAWAFNTQLQAYHWDEYSKAVAEFLQANFLITTLAQVLLDIGVNYEGWSKEQAYDYLKDMGFVGYEDYLYEYTLNVPAYDLCYAIGYIEFDQLRTTAQQQLGEQFSLKEFYKFYLDMGPVPFEVIQKRMDSWLEG